MIPFIEFKDVYMPYHMGEVTIYAAYSISFSIEKGEFAVVVGSSGAGKTTKVIKMKNGKIQESYFNKHPLSVDDIEW